MAQVSNEERVMTVALLECWRQYRCLWDMKDDHYSNRDRRNEAYNALLEIYKTSSGNATLSTLKKKLENIRTAYKREEKKVSASETTGAASDHVYVPKLWYYQYLSFLSEKPQISSGTETLEEEGETIDTPLTDDCEPGEEPPSTSTVLPPAVEGPPKKNLGKVLTKKKRK
ncbi:uncharacterized protein LOC124156375 [Ischnura elegans]|uniref:uncharacterized protein LOC124156374 n=1 Tax=Ischnura elegans TaxID=197161 RepID=UPI001ED87663|nr:uncharacterized protein LOC124156374 [Ischnura elegans]XP_046386859.1 uncharacterized protein LOC124156375 [Ischnura elegans]